jgi:putative nucleotidyltransferase with HDIG domain
MNQDELNKNVPEIETTDYDISVDRLQPGVFIRITGLRWLDHPFFFSAFKISKPEQIRAIKQAGIKMVTFVPGKSDVFPLPESPEEPVQPAAPAPVKDAESERLWEEKKKRIELQKAHRKKIIKCEKQFAASVETVRNVMKNIEGGDVESVKEADSLLQTIVDDLLVEKDTAVQLMTSDPGGQGVFYHSLNVSVLAMMLGREDGLSSAELKILGLGSLFHDVGKSKLPRNLVNKSEPLKKFEADMLRLHPKYGVEIMGPMAKSGAFPGDALLIIRDHHERVDGSGYPAGLDGKNLSVMTKIVSIVNRYDNLCNNIDYTRSLTPHEALAYMFAKERARFDDPLLQKFIAYMGIYPPGTVVMLNNEITGMVISVNPTNALRPNLLIYDPDISVAEALIFDLAEDSSLSIVKSIRPAQLPPKIYNYLNPRTRVSYFLSAEEKKPSKTTAGNTRATG